MAVLTEPEQALPTQIQQAVDALKAQAESEAVDYTQVAAAAKPIADNLKSDGLRSQLGVVGLMAVCGRLLSGAGGSVEPSTQLLRVIGNLAFDHNDNRARALDAGVVSAVLALLATTIETANATSTLSIDSLKLIRAGVGALLNLSLKFDPVKAELAKSDALKVLLSIIDSNAAAPVYVVGSWASAGAESEEKLSVGATVLSWVVNILEDVLEKDKALFPPEGVATLASVILPIATNATSTSAGTWDQEEISEFAETDLELLTSAASLLEALSIDLDSAKHAIAFSGYPSPAPTEPATLLSRLFDFIELTSPPAYWQKAKDSAFGEKGFATVKSAVMRAVVEAPNSDEVMDKLFAGQDRLGKSWVVEKLVEWVREPKEGREDMLICAAHMLAALGRNDEHCVVLVQDYQLAPALAAIAATQTALQLGPPATRPRETTQILFGVISLLRHLSIPAKNKVAVGNTGIIGTTAQLLNEQLDVVGPLQNAVVGLVKHLTAGNVANSLSFLAGCDKLAQANGAPTPEDTQTPPIDFLLPLIPRTDDVRLRSEATRVLINVIRSLFSTRPPSANNPTPTISPVTAFATPLTVVPNTAATVVPSSNSSSNNSDEERKKAGRLQVVRKEVVAALAEMVRLSEKYPMLINEAIVGLTLLAGSGAKGALLVLDALLEQHAPPPPPAEHTQTLEDPDKPTSPISPTTPGRTTSLAISAQGDPPRAVDMLVNWFGLTARGQLDDKRPSDVRPEMVTNAAALVITVLRTGEVATANGEDASVKAQVGEKLSQVRAKVVGSLTGAREETEREEGANEGLKRTLGRALEVVRG